MRGRLFFRIIPENNIYVAHGITFSYTPVTSRQIDNVMVYDISRDRISDSEMLCASAFLDTPFPYARIFPSTADLSSIGIFKGRSSSMRRIGDKKRTGEYHGEIIISQAGKEGSIRQRELLRYVARASYRERYNFKRAIRRFEAEFRISCG